MDKDAVPVGEFRRECRAFADHWIGVQREEFKRLGVEGDWDHYYSTMAYSSEAVIANELGKFLMNGGLYKGSKAVLWSVVEKTALAEAEIEYHDHTSDTVHVRFPVVRSKGGKLDGAAVVIWTTTPWTMPGNRALAYGKDIAYALVEVAAAAEDSKAKVGRPLVDAQDRIGGDMADFLASCKTEAAQAMQQKASAKVAMRDAVCRRRNALRLDCVRNQSWIMRLEADAIIIPPALTSATHGDWHASNSSNGANTIATARITVCNFASIICIGDKGHVATRSGASSAEIVIHVTPPASCPAAITSTGTAIKIPRPLPEKFCHSMSAGGNR